MTKTFSVHNFEKHQHYKERTPPWIKLLNSTLDDYEIGALPDHTKAHLFAIWLLASRYSNKIPYDAEWIAKRINANTPVDLKILEKCGFIIVDQSCSDLLADCYPSRTREEGEGEGERKKEDVPSSKENPNSLGPNDQASTDVQSAFNAYNDCADRSGLPKAQILTAPRKSKIQQRLKDCGGLTGWDVALKKMQASSFLTGSTGWKADLDFILQARSFTKLMEGSYDNRKPTANRTNSRIASDEEIRERCLSAALQNMGHDPGRA